MQVFKSVDNVHWADKLGNTNEAIQKELDKLLIETINVASTRQKVASILAAFRTANDTWRNFARKLKQDFPAIQEDLESKFIEYLSQRNSELYAICVRKKVFIGHTPTIQQIRTMSLAEETLARDRQPRLALKLWNEAF